jgi:hypothetical protein
MKYIPLANAKHLTDIPGVGSSIADDLRSLGYSKPSDLSGENPKSMYERLMAQSGTHIDRCVLYVFRCAVYYAQTDNPDPDRLLWWSWKDNTKQRSKRV